MTVKGFRVEKLTDFLSLADQVSSPKFLDNTNEMAFFYARKRIEYSIKSAEDSEKLLRSGFIQGTEIETFESY